MLGLTKADRIEIEEDVKEKINNLKEKELPEFWKKFFVRAKTFKKNSKDYIKYMSIADYIYIKHYHNSNPESV